MLFVKTNKLKILPKRIRQNILYNKSPMTDSLKHPPCHGAGVSWKMIEGNRVTLLWSQNQGYTYIIFYFSECELHKQSKE